MKSLEVIELSYQIITSKAIYDRELIRQPSAASLQYVTTMRELYKQAFKYLDFQFVGQKACNFFLRLKEEGTMPYALKPPARHFLQQV